MGIIDGKAPGLIQIGDGGQVDQKGHAAGAGQQLATQEAGVIIQNHAILPVGGRGFQQQRGGCGKFHRNFSRCDFADHRFCNQMKFFPAIFHAPWCAPAI